MCGIVSYIGQGNGLVPVLEALRLLEYRAPDSAGIAVLAGPRGELALRRAAGSPARLIETIIEAPLQGVENEASVSSAELAVAQTEKADSPSTCSSAVDSNDLFRPGGASVGEGDLPSCADERASSSSQFSRRLRRILEGKSANGLEASERDPVGFAIGLVAAQVGGPAAIDPQLRRELDVALRERLEAGDVVDWLTQWHAEMKGGVPGPAFAVAVRHFQERFEGLADVLRDDEWERVGGLTAQAMGQVVLGHARWAMVGAVSEKNAHPLLDRSGSRAVCENGSHNAPLVLRMREEQESWWRARGIGENEPVHRSANSTEIIVCEWERASHQVRSGELDEPERHFISTLESLGVSSVEEQALRLALWRMQTGNTHACVFYGQREPGILYASSHLKPLAIVTRTRRDEHGNPERHELMVTSDVNAALMLWDGAEVDRAGERLRRLKKTAEGHGRGKAKAAARHEIEELLNEFAVEVSFLDQDVNAGRQLFARISQRVENGRVVPDVQFSSYNGAPLAVATQTIRLDPSMASRGGYESYTENHIAEIPDMLDTIVRDGFRRGRARLDSAWDEGVLLWPGLNVGLLREQYGRRLGRLARLFLVGEGCSLQAAQAVAPIFRTLLPGHVVIVQRPVDLLAMERNLDGASDLAIEVSWSGTTDSVLKADNLFAKAAVPRIAITGRPQSDLGRRTASSGGTIDVRTGPEMSIAAVKGFEATATMLVLLALQTARMSHFGDPEGITSGLSDELRLTLPGHVRAVIEDQHRRERLRTVARRFGGYNKVAVVGSSPITEEAELKIEKLAQVVTCSFDFYDASLRAVIERSAVVEQDKNRVLFVINATTLDSQREADTIINYLGALGVASIVHTTPHALLEAWREVPGAEVFVSPQVTDLLQPLVDAPFFFELAISLAYARGLSATEVDRPRNLAKSVTTTNSPERRFDPEGERQRGELSLAQFCSTRLARTAWDSHHKRASRAALGATVELRAALALLSTPVPERLVIGEEEHLAVVTDTESTENAANMAISAWQSLLGIDLVVFRRFQSEVQESAKNTGLLKFIRAGAVLSVRDNHTIALPSDMSPLQLELLTAYYLVCLAVRLSRQRGANTSLWEGGLAQLPLVADEIRSDDALAERVAEILSPLVDRGLDKAQIVGGGQDYSSALSVARTMRQYGFLAEALHTDSAWHGPLATVGGGDAEHDSMIVLFATDPEFWEDALVEAQIYRTRDAPLVMVVPEGNASSPTLNGVRPSAVLEVPRAPRPFIPLVNSVFGAVLARELNRLWEER